MNRTSEVVRCTDGDSAECFTPGDTTLDGLFDNDLSRRKLADLPE